MLSSALSNKSGKLKISKISKLIISHSEIALTLATGTGTPEVGVTGLLLGVTAPPESPDFLTGVLDLNVVMDWLAPCGRTKCSRVSIVVFPLPEITKSEEPVCCLITC